MATVWRILRSGEREEELVYMDEIGGRRLRREMEEMRGIEKRGVEDIKKTYEVIAKQIDIVSVG